MADFTPTQGRYLSYIDAYIRLHGFPPAESEIATAMCVSPPSVNQMVKTLEKRGLIERRPGQPRSIRVLVAADEIPQWNKKSVAATTAKTWAPIAERPSAPPASLFVLSVTLTEGPISKKFAGKRIERVIEIRGDQTLEDLHEAIFDAYDRFDQHLYEFQFGKRPFDPKGARYGVVNEWTDDKGVGDARATRIADLELKPKRVFGYWFDFGDDWFHQIAVERIDQAIPTVNYPRVVKRVGKSPPQYAEDR
jgi:hypothetical protein